MLKILRIDNPEIVTNLQGETAEQATVTFAEFGRENLTEMNEQYKIADKLFGRNTSALSSEEGIPRTHRMPIALIEGKLIIMDKQGNPKELKEGDELDGHLNRVLHPTPPFPQSQARIVNGKKVYIQTVLAQREVPDHWNGDLDKDFKSPTREEQEEIFLRQRSNIRNGSQGAPLGSF